MKKSEAMDLYEGLNEISPKMIDEAGNYKKTSSADIGHTDCKVFKAFRKRIFVSGPSGIQ